MRSTSSLTNTAETAKLTALSHWIFTALLSAAFAFTLITFLAPTLHLPGSSNAPEIALLLLATASTLMALARQLPLQNVLLAAFIVALVGSAVRAFGAKTGIPFGPFTFGPESGPKLLKTASWATPMVWIVIVFNSRGVARLILRPWRKTKTYGFWLMGLASVLTTLFVIAFDPFASRVKHYWFWTSVDFPLQWQGAPLVNFLSWGIVTLLMLAFVTPALISKRLSKRSTPDYHPLFIWLGGILIFGIACAQKGFWPAAAVDAAIGIVTIVFAVRGARW